MTPKEFIPYEQALTLKELGFDEPCFGYYYTTNGKDWKFAEKAEFYRLDDEINIGGKFSLLAPTFSQAFRWFREKYDLPNHIDTYWQHDWNDYSYQWSITENHIAWNSTEHYKSYEEAELACLIKLIEIVKGGNQ